MVTPVGKDPEHRSKKCSVDGHLSNSWAPARLTAHSAHRWAPALAFPPAQSPGPWQATNICRGHIAAMGETLRVGAAGHALRVRVHAGGAGRRRRRRGNGRRGLRVARARRLRVTGLCVARLRLLITRLRLLVAGLRVAGRRLRVTRLAGCTVPGGP